jgi:predicted RecB family endonuclease
MEDHMPTFILSLNWTGRGIRAVKEAPKRSQAAKKLAKKLGVEIKQVYLTSGKVICSSSLNLQVAIASPNSRSQPVRSETFAPEP